MFWRAMRISPDVARSRLVTILRERRLATAGFADKRDDRSLGCHEGYRFVRRQGLVVTDVVKLADAQYFDRRLRRRLIDGTRGQSHLRAGNLLP
jgi:hypothetical protein